MPGAVRLLCNVKKPQAQRSCGKPITYCKSLTRVGCVPWHASSVQTISRIPTRYQKERYMLPRATLRQRSAPTPQKCQNVPKRPASSRLTSERKLVLLQSCQQDKTSPIPALPSISSHVRNPQASSLTPHASRLTRRPSILPRFLQLPPSPSRPQSHLLRAGGDARLHLLQRPGLPQFLVNIAAPVALPPPSL